MVGSSWPGRVSHDRGTHRGLLPDIGTEGARLQGSAPRGRRACYVGGTMRALLPGLLVIAALPALLPGRAGAEPCSPALDPLVAEVERRAHLVQYPVTPEQKAEKKGLARVLRVLRRVSTTYGKDVRAAGFAGAALL